MITQKIPSQRLSKVATIIVFLALFRTLIEPFRLHYQNPGAALCYKDIELYLSGATIAAIGLLGMIVLSYFRLYKWMIALCVLCILILVLLKQAFQAM